MNEIVLGVVASLVASVIWFFGGQLILTIKSREKINFLLERLYDCAEQFDTAIVFSIADVAETQVDKILEYTARIREEMKTLTFFGKKKKFFNTILFNAYYTVSYYKRLSVGYDGEREQLAILNKFKRKYYYSVPVYDKNDEEHIREYNFLLFSVAIMQALNNKYLVKEALKNNLFVHEKWNINIITTYLKLISLLSFKSEYKMSKYDLREKTFKQEEYQHYIKRKLKDASKELRDNRK